jgi:hypothetical protein
MDYAYGTPGTEIGQNWSRYFEVQEEDRRAEEREREQRAYERALQERRRRRQYAAAERASIAIVQQQLPVLRRLKFTNEEIYKYIYEYIDAIYDRPRTITLRGLALIQDMVAWKAKRKRSHALALITEPTESLEAAAGGAPAAAAAPAAAGGAPAAAAAPAAAGAPAPAYSAGSLLARRNLEDAEPAECSVLNTIKGVVKKTKNSCTVMGGKRRGRRRKTRR